jgi:pilus assembly protein CpaF
MAAVTTQLETGRSAPDGAPTPQVNPDLLKWRRFLHERLIEQLDLRRKDVHRMSDEALRAETASLLREILARHDRDIPRALDRAALLGDVLNESVGLGPLERLLADDAVTEVMVNRPDEIFVERAGRLERSDCFFSNDAAVLGVIERIITPLGRRIDESMPMVDARLKDGSRVNAIIAPLAIKGSSITIRKFAKRRLTTADLAAFGSISPEMIEFLRVCVEQRRNIIVSGGTGSGKTTLLNVLSNFIPPGERIVTIEDAAELRLHHDNLVSLEARPANIEGKGAIAIRDLVRNSLRMRPDRIVVGECRGGEALDMLQAMNTGHDGSLTTLHANSPRDALARLEVMVLMAGMDLPVAAIREQVASAVNVIVQQTRFACGARKVTHITEVAGIESGRIQLQDIFVFEQTGQDATGRTAGDFRGCGFVPGFYESLARSGVALDLSIFGGFGGP